MKKILITGATGHLGAAVVEELLLTVPAASISILVREVAKADSFAHKGVNVVPGDYNDYSSLVTAFNDVEKLYFVSGNDIEHRAAQHENVVRAAVEARVGHVVYTSFQRKTEDGSSPIAFIASAHLLTDKLLRESGLNYTLLKHALYTDVLPMFIGEQVFETGTIFLPAGEGRAAYASRSDMAKAAAVILTTTGHENKTYDIAGKQSYSFDDIAGILSELSGKTVKYVSPSAAVFQEQLTTAGVAPEAIQGASTFCQAIAEGEFDFPDGTLADLKGDEPETVKIFLKKAYNL